MTFHPLLFFVEQCGGVKGAWGRATLYSNNIPLGHYKLALLIHTFHPPATHLPGPHHLLQALTLPTILTLLRVAAIPVLVAGKLLKGGQGMRLKRAPGEE